WRNNRKAELVHQELDEGIEARPELGFGSAVNVDEHRAGTCRGWAIHVRGKHARSTANAIPRLIPDQLRRHELAGIDGPGLAPGPALDRVVLEVVHIHIAR